MHPVSSTWSTEELLRTTDVLPGGVLAVCLEPAPLARAYGVR